MATYDRNALRLLSPQGIRGGAGGKGYSVALDKLWVDKVTIDVNAINDLLATNIAAGDILTFGEVTRDQVLWQGGVRVHTASAAAATLDLGTSADRDAFLDGTSIASTGHTVMIAATETPQAVAPSTSTTPKTITLEFKTGTAAGAVFTVWWAWLDLDLDDKFLGVP